MVVTEEHEDVADVVVGLQLGEVEAPLRVKYEELAKLPRGVQLDHLGAEGGVGDEGH